MLAGFFPVHRDESTHQNLDDESHHLGMPASAEYAPPEARPGQRGGLLCPQGAALHDKHRMRMCKVDDGEQRYGEEGGWSQAGLIKGR